MYISLLARFDMIMTSNDLKWRTRPRYIFAFNWLSYWRHGKWDWNFFFKKVNDIIYNPTSVLSIVGTSLAVNNLYFEVAAYYSLSQTFGYGQFAAFNLPWHIVKLSQLTTSKHIKHKFAVLSEVALFTQTWHLHLVAHHKTKRGLKLY